jgi:hypothetical protein
MAAPAILKKRKFWLLSCAIIFVLIWLFTPVGFILGEMVLIPILYGANPTGFWILVAVITLPVLWWLWGPRKNKT